MTDEYIHQVHEKFLTVPPHQWFSVNTQTLGNITEVLKMLTTRGHSIEIDEPKSLFRRLSKSTPYNHLTHYVQSLTDNKITIENSGDNEWDEFDFKGKRVRAKMPPRIVIKLDGRIIGIESVK